MLYLQENIRQQTLANIFGTSQPTISRAINTEAYSAAGKIHLRQQVEDQKEYAI